MKLIYYIPIAIILLLTGDGFGQDITKPLTDFLARYDRGPDDKVYRLICDVDHDGQMDVFLAFSSNLEKNGDCGWTLYLKRDAKYIDAPGLSDDGNPDSTLGITFNIHEYVIGNISELGKWGLLTTETGTGDNNGTQLKAVIIEGNAFKMVDVGAFIDGNATPAPGPSRFPQPPTPAIEELNP